MNQSVKIKLGNITNLSDARFAAAAGIDYMGFCFDPKNINYIAPVKAKEIIDWTSGSFVVAEFGGQSITEVADIVEMLNIDIVEINNNLLPNDLTNITKPIIKKIDISLLTNNDLKNLLENYNLKVDCFHLYASSNVILTTQDFKNICNDHKIIWGINTKAETIKNVIDTYQPYAINITGGKEEKTGVKDFDELNNMLEALGMVEG